MEETPKKKAWGDDSDSDENGIISRMEDLKPDFVETKTQNDDESVRIRVITSPRAARTPMASPKNIRSPMGSPRGVGGIRSPIGSPKNIRSANSSPDRDRRGGRGGKTIAQVTDPRRRETTPRFSAGRGGEFVGATPRERLPLGGGDARLGDVRLGNDNRSGADAGRGRTELPRSAEPSREEHRAGRSEGRTPLRLEHGTFSGERTPRGREGHRKEEEAPVQTPRSYQKLQLLPRSASSDQSLASQASKLFGEAKPREIVLAARKERDKSVDGETTSSPASPMGSVASETPSLSRVSSLSLASTLTIAPASSSPMPSGTLSPMAPAVSPMAPSLSPMAPAQPPVASNGFDDNIPMNDPAVVRRFSGRGGRGRGNPMSVETNHSRSRGSLAGEEEALESSRSRTSMRAKTDRSSDQSQSRNDGSDSSRSVSRESRVREGHDSARNSFSKVPGEDVRNGSNRVRDDSRGSLNKGVLADSRESSRSASRGGVVDVDDLSRSASLSRTKDGITASLSRVKSSEELRRGTGRGIQTVSDGRSVSGRGRGVGAPLVEENDSSRGRTKNWGRGGGCTVKVDVREPKDKEVVRDKERQSPLNLFEALAEDESSDH